MAVDEAKFQLSVGKLKSAKDVSTGDDPVKTVELLADRYVLNQNERGSILRHFIMAGDNSQYGLINAVTRASQDAEDYGRATELERLGGELLAVTPKKNGILQLPPVPTLQQPEEPVSNIIALAR